MCEHVFSAAITCESEVVECLFLCRHRKGLGIKIENAGLAAVSLSVFADHALIGPPFVAEYITAIHATDGDDHSYYVLTFSVWMSRRQIYRLWP